MLGADPVWCETAKSVAVKDVNVCELNSEFVKAATSLTTSSTASTESISGKSLSSNARISSGGIWSTRGRGARLSDLGSRFGSLGFRA